MQRRRKQLQPHFGPVSLIYTDANLLLRHEEYSTNEAALKRFSAVFHANPRLDAIIVDDSSETLWLEDELRCVFEGKDAELITTFAPEYP